MDSFEIPCDYDNHNMLVIRSDDEVIQVAVKWGDSQRYNSITIDRQRHPALAIGLLMLKGYHEQPAPKLELIDMGDGPGVWGFRLPGHVKAREAHHAVDEAFYNDVLGEPYDPPAPEMTVDERKHAARLGIGAPVVKRRRRLMTGARP